jgi:hypothetical protein
MGTQHAGQAAGKHVAHAWSTQVTADIEIDRQQVHEGAEYTEGIVKGHGT